MIATKYKINNDVSLELRDQLDDNPDNWKWAITKYGNTLNDKSEWEYEPLPSGRDEKYYKRCRFTFKTAQKICSKLFQIDEILEQFPTESQILKAKEEGYEAAITALSSKQAFKYWMDLSSGKIVENMIVSPNKNDWATWLKDNKKEFVK